VAAFDDAPGDVRDVVADRDDDTFLYVSTRTRVSRRRATRPEPDILTTLAALPGVAHLVATGERSGLALEDVGGVTLASTLAHPARFGRGVTAGRDVARLVDFGAALARVVAGVHRAGVMHKDINPANILITEPGARPVLIDWDLATTVAQEQPGFTHESSIAGTLAYLAPEQSGRTGRGVDQRADLYGVGATLYELAVGRPPFGNGDPLTLIHDHLARVPIAPDVVNPAVPVALSDIIMRLLEKEPDRRYQSAEGLAHDLTRLGEALTGDAGPAGDALRFRLGERDFPIRICAPSQLVGRDQEIAALRGALDRAVAGDARGLLVTGGPGVGKSSQFGGLRSIVTAKAGWFVEGKFDQYRQDETADAVAQAIRALARLLLAEPEDQLAQLRDRIQEAAGADIEVLAAVLPEFTVLLDVAPAQLEDADPQQLGARLFRAALGVLRAVASPERPLVMVIDDLQWAGAFPLAFVDAVLTDDGMSGLLLVGAYRDGEVDEAHPLTATLARWERLGTTPTRLRLANLPPEQLGTLLARMLRLPPERAQELAEAISARTKGNPYDTVELVNALRHDGALTVGDAGWHWDTETIRRFVGRGDVIDLLTARIDALPAGTVALLDVLACLGGEVDLEHLAVAAGLTGATTGEALAPALEDGLLLIQDAAPAVRFRHDRVQQAAAARLEATRRQALHATIARRLAGHPQLAGAAAEQYLACAPDAIAPGERYRVAVLFRSAAAHHRIINQVRSERFLAAAIALLEPAGAEPAHRAPEFELVTQLMIERHAVLFSLARPDEGDELYEQIRQRIDSPIEFAGAAAVQIASLTNRGDLLEAVTLGIDVLTRLGFEPPGPEDIPAVIAAGLDMLERWVAEGPQPGELDRPESTDPRIVAASRVIERTVSPAFNSMHPVMPWLLLTAHELWVEHGPGRGRGTLTIRTRAEDDAVAIEVQDTGTGIPADIADRVFDQFFTTKPVGVGTGQGLSLVHTLITDRHQGGITFTTEPDVGTTFVIRLPNAEPGPG
jgi:hypothetical protein